MMDFRRLHQLYAESNGRYAQMVISWEGVVYLCEYFGVELPADFVPGYPVKITADGMCSLIPKGDTA